MRVLVTGGSGAIGSKFIQKFLSSGHQVFFTYHSHICHIKGAIGYMQDVCDGRLMARLIENVRPDWIIHTAALTDMDICERNNGLADKINAEGTANIVTAARQTGSKVAYISTVAVFGGDERVVVSDESVPNPVNYYGLTKLKGEKIVSDSGLSFLILRTDQPYCWLESWQRKNTVVRVLEKLASGEPVKEVVDWFNQPTFADNFVDIAISLIERNRDGVYNIAGPDFISRYQFACKIAEIFDKDVDMIEPIKSSELNLPAKRSHVKLDSSKVQKETGKKVVGVDEGLKTMKMSQLH